VNVKHIAAIFALAWLAAAAALLVTSDTAPARYARAVPCSPGNFGQAVRKSDLVWVRGKRIAPNTSLRPGDWIRVFEGGAGVICLKESRTTCDVAAKTVMQVRGAKSDVFAYLSKGSVTCGVAGRSRRPFATTRGVRIRLTEVSTSASRTSQSRDAAREAPGGNLFSVTAGTRTTVKVSRGATFVTTSTRQASTVLGRRIGQSGRLVGEQVHVLRSGLGPTTDAKPTGFEQRAFRDLAPLLPKDVDTTAPALDVVRAPGARSSVRRATFAFRAEAGAALTCALDDEIFVVCDSPYQVARAAPGSHRFSVKATDASGNVRRVDVRWTVDSSRIAFTSFRHGNPELYTVTPDGETVVRLTTDTDAGNLISDEDPDWSPDGRQVAFERLGPADLDIWIVQADGSGSMRRLTSDPARDQNPSWSPDGTRIAFESYRGGSRDIYVTNANGSGTPIRLTSDPAEDLDPTWSPDSRRIAFASSRDGNLEIYVMNADGSGQTRLTTQDTPDFGPNWSPDGRRILFQSRRSPPYFQVFAMNADGSGVTPLTRAEQDANNPAWAPDSTHFVFYRACPEGGEPQLWIGDVNDVMDEVRITPCAGARNYLPDW
jgi:TolB protein